MARILVSDGLEKSAVEQLKKLGHEVVEQFYAEDELKEQVKNFDAVIVRSATKITKKRNRWSSCDKASEDSDQRRRWRG